MCFFILFYSHSHLPIPTVNHSNGSMCTCLFVCINANGIVLYACIFNLFKYCVIDLILCLTFFTSSVLRFRCYVYV